MVCLGESLGRGEGKLDGTENPGVCSNMRLQAYTVRLCRDIWAEQSITPTFLTEMDSAEL